MKVFVSVSFSPLQCSGPLKAEASLSLWLAQVGSVLSLQRLDSSGPVP